MSRKMLTSLDMGKNQFISPVIENLGSAPSTPVKGQMYFDSGGNVLYWYNGSGWVAAQGGAGAVPATTVTTQAVGDAAVVGVATTYAREDHKHGRESFGAITASTSFGQATSNGAAVTLARSDHVHGTPAAPALNALTATADVAFAGFKLTGIGTPIAATDASTKGYVDGLVQGLAWKDAVRVATTVNLTRTGLTAIDGVTPIAGDRILVKNQTAGQENGIFVAAAGSWTRALDADVSTELESFAVFVMEGTQADTAWNCTTNAPITVDTTPLTIVQFGAGTAYLGGAGLTLTSSTFDVVAANGSITVAANDIQVGYAGTGTTFGSAVTAARSDHNHDGTYTKKFSQDCAAATSTTVTHNLNTQDVIVAVYLKSGTFEEVDVDIEHTSVNVVTVRFAVAPAAGAYRIVVTG